MSKFLNSIVIEQSGKLLGDIAGLSVQPADGAALQVVVTFHTPLERAFPEIRGELERAARERVPGERIEFDLATDIQAHGVQRNLKPLPDLKNIVAVASGKGGVGKSTVAANLALALAGDGARVGVLDADIYGPSQPHMFGLVGQRPVSEDGKTMQPLEAHGLQIMSIGFLVDPDQPMVWRGPMVTSALNQLLHQTEWRDLDYLVVDMPPGTGDIQLTLSQQVPVSGAVIVTTPQDIAAIDARKGLAMFRKVSIPVLGVIENMSTHACTACGHEEPIFGEGGAARIAADFDVPLLGQLPLAASVREQTDAGRPPVAGDPDSVPARAFIAAARRMSAELATRGRDYAGRFPNIVVEDS